MALWTDVPSSRCALPVFGPTRWLSGVDIAFVGRDFAGCQGLPKWPSKAQAWDITEGKRRKDKTEARMRWTTPARAVRGVGVFLLNVVVAVLGTAVLESPFEHYAHVFSLRESLLLMDLLTAAFAFGVGYSVYWRWQPAASKWAWIAGVCWLGQRAIFPPDGNHVVIWEMHATNSVFLDVERLGNWSVYTLPFLRTTFYSVGAYCCSRPPRGHNSRDSRGISSRTHGSLDR